MTSTSEIASPAALPTRPEVQTFELDELVRGVCSGQIRVPSFHRGIKWDARDALILLDSIDRGYPVGTLLLWQRPARKERLVHGTVVIDAPDRADALWVIDGQQRIVSLTRVLAGAGFPSEPFAGFYDLKAAKCKRIHRSETPAAHDLPLTEVLDSARLIEWLSAHPDASAHRQAALQFGKRVREYKVLAYVVTTDDEQAVREIFRRTNTTGKRMEDSDIFEALYSADGPAAASLGSIAGSLGELAFGPLPESTLHNMFLATRGADLSKDRLPELSPPQAQSAMLELARCARSVIRFLRDDAGIPHISLLPYPQVLFPLARFFHHFPEPHPRTRELLSRWVWRGALTEYDGARLHASPLLAHIGEDEHTAIQSMLRALDGRPRPRIDLADYSFSHTQSKIELLALLDLGPRDLHDGELVAPRETERGNNDAYRSLVRTIVPRDREPSGGLEGRMFHPSVRTGLARAIVECEDLTLLASHAISAEARHALKFDRLDEFFRLRRADLLAHVDNFTERRAQWDEPDTPPVEALRIGGD